MIACRGKELVKLIVVGDGAFSLQTLDKGGLGELVEAAMGALLGFKVKEITPFRHTGPMRGKGYVAVLVATELIYNSVSFVAVAELYD